MAKEPISAARQDSPGWASRIALSFVAVCVALLIAEAAARLSGLRPQYGHIAPVWGSAVRTVDGVDLWNTQSPRVTDADIARAADSDAYTIVGLGDSIMYGDTPNNSPTYLDLTRRRLIDRGAGPLEILNLAVPGYNTKQEAIVFKEVDDRLDADLVIVHYWGNDVHQFRVVGGYVVDYGDIAPDGTFVIRALPLPAAVSDYLLIHSRVYELLSQFVVQWRRQRWVGEEWSTVAIPMAAIDERARKGGGRLLILASPEMDGPWPKTAVDFPVLQRFATKRGIEVIDLAGWVRDRPSTEVGLDGVHFTAEGHRIIGERLAEHLLGHELKDRAPPIVSQDGP